MGEKLRRIGPLGCDRRGIRWWTSLPSVALAATLLLIVSGATSGAPSQVSPTTYLTLVMRGRTCAGLMPPGETYGALRIEGSPSDRPAEAHPDLNLAVRSYVRTEAFLGLVDYGGGSDPRAPQLRHLFSSDRIPEFTSAYQVYMWGWSCNCREAPIPEPSVTLLGLQSTPGEPIRVPASGYRIGEGYEVLVLLAKPLSVTLKYTREDNVVSGYTLHLEGICVAPGLLELYEGLNEAGRERLPALRPGQTLGRALGDEIRLAVRDSGTFLDPRSRKDWWQDQ